MKGHVGRSSNVRRLIGYVLRDQISDGHVRAPRIVSGMAPSVREDDLVAEFKAVAQLRALATTVRPSPSTPWTWMTRLARSTPTRTICPRVICSMTSPSKLKIDDSTPTILAH